MSKTSTATSSISSTSLLTIAFIVLKLCKVIDWSWWWVTAPTWIPVAIALLVLAFVCLFAFLNKKKGISKLPDYQHTPPPSPKSKFMQKLDKAMARSEAERNARNN
jgi:MFS superfamily sulfate permease-like transporter